MKIFCAAVGNWIKRKIMYKHAYVGAVHACNYFYSCSTHNTKLRNVNPDQISFYLWVKCKWIKVYLQTKIFSPNRIQSLFSNTCWRTIRLRWWDPESTVRITWSCKKYIIESMKVSKKNFYSSYIVISSYVTNLFYQNFIFHLSARYNPKIIHYQFPNQR